MSLHINQTAMGDILVCALIDPTATFISHSAIHLVERLNWSDVHLHDISLLHLADHRDEAQSLAGSDT